MLILWRLLHFFGFVFWFVGLLGTTSAQVAARKARDPEARRGAWAVVRRLQPMEIVGMILTPLSGIWLTKTVYGGLFGSSPPFVHIKLLLVIIAVVFNVLVIVKRRKAETALLAGDHGGFLAALRTISIFEGIATLMLPAAIVVVVVLKYGG